MWDWWQWRPHEAKHNFCFSIFDPVRPTKARWYGHNSSIPEKRTGRNPGMDFETEYTLDYSADRFDISIDGDCLEVMADAPLVMESQALNHLRIKMRPWEVGE